MPRWFIGLRGDPANRSDPLDQPLPLAHTVTADPVAWAGRAAADTAGAPRLSSAGSRANRSRPARALLRASPGASPRPSRALSSQDRLAVPHDRHDPFSQAGPVRGVDGTSEEPERLDLSIATGGHRSPFLAGAVRQDRREIRWSARKTSRAVAPTRALHRSTRTSSRVWLLQT